MQTINLAIEKARSRFFNSIYRYTDYPYYILRHKQDKTQEDKKYMTIYENTLSMHLISLVLMIPATFFGYKYMKFKKANSLKQNRLLLYSFTFPFSLSFTFFTISIVYEYYYEFDKKTKQIQNQYYVLIQDIKKHGSQKVT